jgi:VIT1/CCC1 family predicted Fe2+/Mn2+ transporter
MSWKLIIAEYLDLNNRYQEAVIRKARRQDAEALRASGAAGVELKRSPFSASHQFLMFVSAFVGVFLQNSVSQYINSQPIILSLPTVFEVIVYSIISLALMPFIYSRFAKIPFPPMIVQIGWAVTYGFFSRPALAAIKDLIVAGLKLLTWV